MNPERKNEISISNARGKRKGRAEAIAGLLQELPQGTHLTAPEVFELAQKAGIQISLSSVYRTLGMLKSEGVVAALSGEHGVRYEALDEDHDHDHLICMVCGFTIEFADDLLKGFGQDLARRNGYEYKRSKFDIYGLCETCSAKSEQFKIRQAQDSLRAVLERVEPFQETVERALATLELRKLERTLELIGTLADTLQVMQTELEVAAGKLQASPAEASEQLESGSRNFSHRHSHRD